MFKEARQKQCLGNIDYRTKECINCKDSFQCEKEYNTKNGACDCEFKEHCHIPRQSTQMKCRTEKQSNSDCWFYKQHKKAENKKN